jgi:hypothetical protein
MPSSARILIESCRCGAGVPEICVCSTYPFGETGLPPVQASTAADLDRARVGGKPTGPTPYDKNRVQFLLQAMRRAGVDPPYGAGKRLTTSQMAALVAGQDTISGKINMRLLCHDAEIEPGAG